jgi:hypothetical protein
VRLSLVADAGGENRAHYCVRVDEHEALRRRERLGLRGDDLRVGRREDDARLALALERLDEERDGVVGPLDDELAH